MKKLLYASMAFALMLSACSTDDVESNNLGGQNNATEVSVKIGVAAPVALSSKADEPTTDSSKGGLTNIDWAEYDLRYQMAVYSTDGNQVLKTPAPVIKSEGGDAEFALRITPGEYKFVLWADFVKDGATTDLHYNTTDLAAITEMTPATVAINDESRDAYSFTGNINVTDNYNGTIELTRPMAKLRIVTTDVTELMNGVVLKSSKLSGSFPSYTFNAVSGEVTYGAAAEVDHTAPLAVYANDSDAATTLLTMYAFVNGGGNEVAVPNFSFEVFSDEAGTSRVRKYDFTTDIPLVRNKLTTIKGNILTTSTKFTIKVEEGMDGSEITHEMLEVSSAEELQDALNDPEVDEIILTGDIELGGSIIFNGIGTRADVSVTGRDFTIDGNGKSLIYTGSGDRVISMESSTNGANLTIKNITILNKSSNDGTLSGGAYLRGINYNTTGTLTLDNVKMVAEEGSKHFGYAVNLPGSSVEAKVIIKNSEITSGYTALNVWGRNSDISVDNSELSSYNEGLYYHHAAIQLNESSDATSEGTKLTITKSKITSYRNDGSLGEAIDNATNAPADITISDDCEIIGEVVDKIILVENEDVADGGSLFSSLDEALELAYNLGEKGTLLILQDITFNQTLKVESGKTLNIDLNGHSLQYAVENDGKAAAMIANYGTLNITNSNEEKEGYITFVAADPDMERVPSYATNTISNFGNLTIGKGVTVINESDGGASYAVDNHAYFTLDGGTLLAKRTALRIAKYNPAVVEFTMKSGLVKANTPAWIQLPSNDSSFAPSITVTIEDGTFESTDESGSQYILYPSSNGNSYANTNITINGGKFLNGWVSIVSGNKGDVPTLTINGGQFEYDVIMWDANNEYKVLYNANYTEE